MKRSLGASYKTATGISAGIPGIDGKRSPLKAIRSWRDVDDTLVGGKVKGGDAWRWATGASGSGRPWRDGEESASASPTSQRGTLHDFIKRCTRRGRTCHIYQELRSYNGIADGKRAIKVRHAARRYGLCGYHTNSREAAGGSFERFLATWARGIHQTYGRRYAWRGTGSGRLQQPSITPIFSGDTHWLESSASYLRELVTQFKIDLRRPSMRTAKFIVNCLAIKHFGLIASSIMLAIIRSPEADKFAYKPTRVPRNNSGPVWLSPGIQFEVFQIRP